MQEYHYGGLQSGQYQNLVVGGFDSPTHSKWNHWYGQLGLSHAIIGLSSSPCLQ